MGQDQSFIHPLILPDSKGRCDLLCVTPAFALSGLFPDTPLPFQIHLSQPLPLLAGHAEAFLKAFI